MEMLFGVSAVAVAMFLYCRILYFKSDTCVLGFCKISLKYIQPVLVVLKRIISVCAQGDTLLLVEFMARMKELNVLTVIVAHV